MYYKEKHRLLELYNSLNHTSYTNDDDLTITTLENAIFIGMKNDVSFLVSSEICLYEHQSTYCPNMPLRGLLYFAELYQKMFKDIEVSSNKLIKIPAPHYIVFYNGTERKEESFNQKLSDSFLGTRDGCLEVTVHTININYGKNAELMEHCQSLREYAQFVATVRKYQETMELTQAMELAVEEYIRKTYREEGEERGKAINLIQSIDNLMKNANIDLSKACKMIGTTAEDYNKAQNLLKES